MSGETEQQVSGWTTDTLHQYIDSRLEAVQHRLEDNTAFNRDEFFRTIAELRSMLDERYATQTKAVDAAFLAQQTAMQTALLAAEKAVQTALTAAEKAVIKAEVAADKRFESVNEFRSQLADQANTFMPRAEAEADSQRSIERLAEVSVDVGKAMPRLEAVAMGDRNAERIRELTDRLNIMDGKITGGSELTETHRNGRMEIGQYFSYIIATISVIATIILGIYAIVKP